MIKFETMAGELKHDGVAMAFAFDGNALTLRCLEAHEPFSPQLAMAVLTKIADPDKPKKRRGRPAGSKNKPKVDPDAASKKVDALEMSKKDFKEHLDSRGLSVGMPAGGYPDEPSTPPAEPPKSTATASQKKAPKTAQVKKTKTEPVEKTNGDSGSNGSLLLSDTCPPKLVKARKLGDLITPLYNEAIELGIGESLDGEEQLDEISKTIATRLEAWRGQVPLIDKKAPEKLHGAVARALVVIAPAI